MSVGRNSLDGLAVSLKYHKLYAPNSVEDTPVVLPLGPKGGFTSVPRTFHTQHIRHVSVDDSANLLYAVSLRGDLFVCPLDSHGSPASQPQHYDLKSGDVRDMLLEPKRGVVYLAVTRPPKEEK